MKTRNSEVLASFVKYCEEHPEHRFWQALRNWAGVGFVFAGNLDRKSTGDEMPVMDTMERLSIVKSLGLEDTFYREGKDD